MVRKVNLLTTFVALLATTANIANAGGLGSGIAFQGQLTDGGMPADGLYDMQFTLHSDSDANSPVAPTQFYNGISLPSILVVNGLFTVDPPLDFGASAFDGSGRWIELKVRTSGVGPYTTLSPRTAVTPVPYAIYAANAPDGHSLDAADGDPADVVFVDANGFVGINTTTPEAQFHINDGSIWVGGVGAEGGFPASAGQGIRLFNGVDGNSKIFAFDYAAGLPRPLILQDIAGANVGIGTTNANSRLTVAGVVESTTGGIRFPDGTTQLTAATGGGGSHNTLDQAYDEGGAGAGRVITADAGAVEIAGPDGLTVAADVDIAGDVDVDGNTFHVDTSLDRVGIGTISPNSALDVVGDATVRGGFVADFGTLTVDDEDNAVGIGTTIPNAKLEVRGDVIVNTVGTVVTPDAPMHIYNGSAGNLSAIAASELVLEDNSSSYLTILTPDSSQRGVIFGSASDNNHGGIYYANTSGLSFRTNGNQTRMVVTDTGRVGIGTTNTQGFTLAVSGSAAKIGGGSWSIFSDARLKKNVAALDGTLDKLLALRGVSFEYAQPDDKLMPAGQQVGFVAQEVETVFPDWVDEAENGYKFVTVKGFEALTVEALRELRAEKNAEIAALRAELSKMRSLVSQLKTQSNSQPMVMSTPQR